MANGLKKESTVMIKAFFLWDMGPNKWKAFESFFIALDPFFSVLIQNCYGFGKMICISLEILYSRYDIIKSILCFTK